MKYLPILSFVVGFLLASTILSSSNIMPLSEIREGMVGVGRTVFKGNQIEEFEVEILGVLENYLPQQSLILGVLKGSKLEETGVIAGMSGSPVFVDGKMIGAVAYSWPFAKTPIAGITPIESMLKTQVMPMEQAPIAPPIEIAEYYNFEKLLTGRLGSPPHVETAHPGFGKIQLSPIASSLTVAGFDPKLVERFSPIFSSFGWQAVQGGASVGRDLDPSDTSLEPGSPISVQLIRGDFDIGAIGTVTYRDQDKVLAFGHPFFNLGPINLPMATAKIYAVIPSLYSSFKVGASKTTVGSIRQDLHSAVFGIVGQKSPMIPVSVNLRNENGTKHSFRFEVADHKLLSPILVDFAFQNSILVTQLGFSESTLKVSGSIHLKDALPVEIKNLFSGGASFAHASQYVASILYTLMTNDFKNVEVEEVEINIESAMKRKEAELTEVWIDKNQAHPGEIVKLKAVYRPFLGEPKVENFAIQIPEDLPFSQIHFLVGGGQEIGKWEIKQYGREYRPENLEQLISILNTLRSNDGIYVKAFGRDPSLVMKGQLLQFLPSSVYSILSSSQTIGTSQAVNTLGLWEDSKPVGYFLTGRKTFSIEILPKQN